MKSGKRNQLAEKMAGEITLSDSPGHALKKWRMNFEIAPGVLSERLGVSPSVISDYESGRRKSPGTAVVGKIVDTLLTTDEETGGKHIEKFSTMLFSAVDDDVIYDLHEYGSPVPLKDFSDAIGCTLLCGSIDQTIFGYTVVNSLNAIMQLSSDEFNRIYGWSTERALVFTQPINKQYQGHAHQATPKAGCARAVTFTLELTGKWKNNGGCIQSPRQNTSQNCEDVYERTGGTITNGAYRTGRIKVEEIALVNWWS